MISPHQADLIERQLALLAEAQERAAHARRCCAAKRVFMERQLPLALPLKEGSRARSGSEDARTFLQRETPPHSNHGGTIL
jgi:hypothetical protein